METSPPLVQTGQIVRLQIMGKEGTLFLPPDQNIKTSLAKNLDLAYRMLFSSEDTKLGHMIAINKTIELIFPAFYPVYVIPTGTRNVDGTIRTHHAYRDAIQDGGYDHHEILSGLGESAGSDDGYTICSHNNFIGYQVANSHGPYIRAWTFVPRIKVATGTMGHFDWVARALRNLMEKLRVADDGLENIYSVSIVHPTEAYFASRTIYHSVRTAMRGIAGNHQSARAHVYERTNVSLFRGTRLNSALQVGEGISFLGFYQRLLRPILDVLLSDI